MPSNAQVYLSLLLASEDTTPLTDRYIRISTRSHDGALPVRIIFYRALYILLDDKGLRILLLRTTIISTTTRYGEARLPR